MPNILSFARLALVPVFLWLIVEGEDIAALSLPRVETCTAPAGTG